LTISGRVPTTTAICPELPFGLIKCSLVAGPE
jgi:hypothetical protein